MPRSNTTYAQTVIGACGHQCEGWGAVYQLGEPLPWVPCAECSAKEAGLDEWPYWEPAEVWVRVPIPEEKKRRRKENAKKRAASPNKAKPMRAWERYLND